MTLRALQGGSQESSGTAAGRAAPLLGAGRLLRGRTLKGNGHFRVKIYSKPEVSVIRQHAAKKRSVFHTELPSL